MSWFGFGGDSKKQGDEKPPSIGTEGYSSSPYDSSHPSSFDNGFAAPQQISSGAQGGASRFEQELMREQQNAIVQAVMLKLTELR